MKHRILALTTLFIITVSLAFGDELSIDTIVHKVLMTNSKLTEAQLKFGELDAKRSQFKAKWLPRLIYSLNSMELRQGPRDLFVGSVAIPQPATTFNYHSTSLDIQHQLFDYGNSFRRKKIIDYDSKATLSDYIQDSRELILKTQDQFFQLAEAEELSVLYMDELKDLTEENRLLESLVEKGVKPAIDKIKYDIRLNDLNLKIISENSKIVLLQNDLAYFMGEENRGNFTVQIPTFDPIQTSQALVNFETQKIPSLNKLESQIKAEELRLSIIKWDYLPDVYIRAGYQRGSEIFDAIYSNFDKDWSISYSLSLSFPLNQNRKAKLQEVQSLLEIRRLQEQYQDEKRSGENEYQDLLVAIQSGLEKYELYSKNAAGQESIYRYEYDRYTSGLSEFREMAESRRTLLQSKQGLISLKYELLRNEAKLDVLSGKWDQVIASSLEGNKEKN